MLIWIILTAMTSAAAIWVAAPLLRRYDEAASARANDLEVYKDQLAEVERELAIGQIDAIQAEAATLEIKRRLLGVERAAGTGLRFPTLAERHLSVAMVAGLTVLGSTILYSNMGRPDLPSVARPATELVLGGGGQGTSFRTATGARAAVAGASSTRGPVASQAPAGPAAGVVQGARQELGAAAGPSDGQPPTPRVGSLDEMIQRLIERTKKEPGKADTWRMLGWSYASVERFKEAAEAYNTAIAIEPKNAGLHAARGEALMRVGDGKVQGEARVAVDAALAIDPKEPRARFLKGLALTQTGDKPGGLDVWLGVIADLDPREPAATDLRARALELARELGVDIAARLPAVPVAEDATAQGAGAGAAPERSGGLQLLKDDPLPPKGPSASDVKAAEAMSASDRSAMIRGMVDKLAARLATAPRDADGWLQLMRSRRVLGDMEGARAALTKAVDIFADTPAEQARITAAALEMGISK